MKKSKILIVEDDETMASCLKVFLKRFDYEISAAVSSAAEAIKEVQNNPPDLILMDIVLKGSMNGIEAAKEIASFYNVPFIYLTAYSDGHYLEEAQKTGPFGYIIKPFSDRELRIVVEAALFKYEKDKVLVSIENRCENLCFKNFRGVTFRADLDFMPIFIHGTLEDITGYKEEEIFNNKSRLEEIFCLDRVDGKWQDYLEKVKTIPDFCVHEKTCIRHRNGELKWVQAYIHNVSDEKGNLLNIEGSMFDITKLEELQDMLNEATQSFEEVRRFAFDREGRMIELKKEINKLSVELSRPAPYADLS